MTLSKTRALLVISSLALFACTPADVGDDTILYEVDPAFEAPVIDAPIARSPVEDCPEISSSVDDGIGGTGCAVE